MCQHLQHLETIFLALKKYKLKLKRSKCLFAKNKVDYLGHVISEKGITPNPKKIEAVTNYPTPNNADKLRSFLGLANYYRRFIRNYSELTHPLTILTRKNEQWRWESEQENSFQKVKSLLSSAPILAYPDFTKEFQVHTDASAYGIGAVLAQVRKTTENGTDEVVIAYASKHLTDSQAKWATVEKEAYAIVFATKIFYPYLYGRRFTVYTDHKPLEWLMNIKEPTGRLMRWSLLLQEYDIAIGYRPGKMNQNADSLSRAPLNHIATPVSLGRHKFKEEQEKDEYCQRVRRTLEKKGSRSNFIIRDDGLIGTSDGRVLVPLSLRLNVLRRLHDHKLAAHLGQAKVSANLRHRFFWPGMLDEAKRFVKNCISCQKRKAHKRNIAPLQPLPIVTYVWERVAMDIVGPLECTRSGNRYILVISEYATKYVEAIPMKDQTAMTVAEAFTNRIILRYGCPSHILTDQGPCFQSELMKELCRQLEVNQLRSSPYHTMCNGAVENVNKTICDMLASFVCEDPTLWDEYLPFIVFAYNSSTHISLKETPFYLLYGHDPIQPDLISAAY